MGSGDLCYPYLTKAVQVLVRRACSDASVGLQSQEQLQECGESV